MSLPFSVLPVDGVDVDNIIHTHKHTHTHTNKNKVDTAIVIRSVICYVFLMGCVFIDFMHLYIQ